MSAIPTCFMRADLNLRRSVQIYRGAHWTRIPGFNFKWGHRVVPDPEDPKTIYITTFGGSVWHGRVDGVEQTVDIATPELQPLSEM